MSAKSGNIPSCAADIVRPLRLAAREFVRLFPDSKGPSRDSIINNVYGSLAAMTSTRSIAGGFARRSAACAVNAAAIGLARCACLPDSSGNASKMPEVCRHQSRYIRRPLRIFQQPVGVRHCRRV